MPPDMPEPEPFQDRHNGTPILREVQPMSPEAKFFWGCVTWIALVGFILIAVANK